MNVVATEHKACTNSKTAMQRILHVYKNCRETDGYVKRVIFRDANIFDTMIAGNTIRVPLGDFRYDGSWNPEEILQKIKDDMNSILSEMGYGNGIEYKMNSKELTLSISEKSLSRLKEYLDKVERALRPRKYQYNRNNQRRFG